LLRLGLLISARAPAGGRIRVEDAKAPPKDLGDLNREREFAAQSLLPAACAAAENAVLLQAGKHRVAAFSQLVMAIA